MANTVQSMQPFGKIWVATVSMDTAAAKAVVPAGTIVGVEKITVGPQTATGTGLVTVENAAGDEIARAWAQTVTTQTQIGEPTRLDGLSVRIATPTSIVAVTIHFRHLAGTAVVAI